MEQLYKDKPRGKSTYTRHKNREFTDSLEAYQYGAEKETEILQRNGRVPTVEIVWHLLTVLPPRDIKALKTKVFRYLKDHGIEGVVNIELTCGVDGKPNNTVHFHILTDDSRSETELRRLLNRACELRGLVRGEDFRIDFRRLYDGYRYFKYFTKFEYKHKVILFQKYTGLHKFYRIGKWFTKSKEMLWKEYCAEIGRKKQQQGTPKLRISINSSSSNRPTGVVESPLSFSRMLDQEPAELEAQKQKRCFPILDYTSPLPVGSYSRKAQVVRNCDSVVSRNKVPFFVVPSSQGKGTKTTILYPFLVYHRDSDVKGNYMEQKTVSKLTSPAQMAVCSGFENVGKSMAQIGNFITANPSEFQKAMPAVAEIDRQFYRLAAEARQRVQKDEGLHRTVRETAQTADQIGNQFSNFPNSSGGQFVPTVNSFSELLR